uniref:Uncharacterized protein n=1 Tax=Amphimedon queenslandica TaxID=400682 RepID=A0A1X7SDG0_AMPQE
MAAITASVMLLSSSADRRVPVAPPGPVPSPPPESDGRVRAVSDELPEPVAPEPDAGVRVASVSRDPVPPVGGSEWPSLDPSVDIRCAIQTNEKFKPMRNSKGKAAKKKD